MNSLKKNKTNKKIFQLKKTQITNDEQKMGAEVQQTSPLYICLSPFHRTLYLKTGENRVKLFGRSERRRCLLKEIERNRTAGILQLFEKEKQM